MATTKNITPVPADVLAAARQRAEQTRQQLEHKPSPTELLTPQELVDAAPFYFALRDYIRQLKEARESAGLTLAEVSAQSGMAVESLSRLETGAQTNPTWKTLAAYAAAVGRRPRLTADAVPSGNGGILDVPTQRRKTMPEDQETQGGMNRYCDFWDRINNDGRMEGNLHRGGEPPNTNSCSFPSGWGDAHYGVGFRDWENRVLVNLCLKRSPTTKDIIKPLFDALAKENEHCKIDNEFEEAVRGTLVVQKLEWERRDPEVESWISVYRPGEFCTLDQARLEEIRNWVIEALLALKKVFRPRLDDLIPKLRGG